MARKSEVYMPRDIIDYWFSDDVSELWYRSTPEFDHELTQRFEKTWERAARGELDDWMDTADGCLALVIILDQLPLNMYRGTAKSFSTEAKSREVARVAIDRGFDKTLTAAQRSFLYTPYQHSESLEDQDLAIELFDRAGLEGNLRFSRHHRAIVEKFGRFPHRNEALGRVSSEAEIEYLNSKQAFTG